MWKVGDRLGRFRLDREIGQGSHGVVFVATDTALDAQVAVKILHPWLTQDTAVRDRFKRELLLARRIAHPGVCRLFDLHEEGEAFFITMEFVEGQTLLNILKNEGRLQPLRAVRILRGVCQALSAAHNAGVIHRDLKPANIIVRAGEEPMILDFGTATAGDVSRVTRPGTAVGSMRFIAPEVFTGVAPSIATDVYSLGVVSYVVLAGKLPYNAAAGAIEMLELIRNQPPMRLDVAQPDVPKDLADVVAHAMEKAPETRFKTAKELDEALADVEERLSGAPVARARRDSAIGPAVGGAEIAPPSTNADQPSRTMPGTPTAKVEQTQVTPGTAPPSNQAPVTSHVERKDFEAAFASAFGAPSAETTRVTPVQAFQQAIPEVPETNAGKTVTDVVAPDLTLGSLPPETQGTELPLVTGVVEVTPDEHREIVGEKKPVDDARTAETPRPISIPAGGASPSGDGAFEPRTDETAGGKTTEATQVTSSPPLPPLPEPAAQPTLVVQNPLEAIPTQRLARSAVAQAKLGEPSGSHAEPAPGGPKKALLIAAGVAVLAIVVVIAVVSGGDDDTVAAVDSGTEVDAVDSGAVLVGTDGVDAGEAEPTADAGEEVAVVDAGEVRTADAGEAAPTADAGEPTMDFGTDPLAGFDAGPEIVPEPGPGPDIKRPRPDPAVDGQIRQLRAAMAKKGLIVGDLPAAEEKLVKAHFSGMRGKRAEADKLIAEAKSAVDGQPIDRTFILKKLGRFNSRYDRTRRPDVADKVEPLARDAAAAFSAGQFDAANRKLNQAFALVSKKK